MALLSPLLAGASEPTRVTADMITVIESKLRAEWRPEQISEWLLYNQGLINSRPRKALDVKTPVQLMDDDRAVLAG